MGSRFEERVCFRDENGGVGVDWLMPQATSDGITITSRYSSGRFVWLGMNL